MSIIKKSAEFQRTPLEREIQELADNGLDRNEIFVRVIERLTTEGDTRGCDHERLARVIDRYV